MGIGSEHVTIGGDGKGEVALAVCGIFFPYFRITTEPGVAGGGIGNLFTVGAHAALYHKL